MPGVTVSIPVRTHGYTGQRDQFEQQTKDFTVKYNGERISLVAPSGYGRSFDFSETELKQALDFIRDHGLLEDVDSDRPRKAPKPDPPCSGPGYAHAPHGNCPGYATDRT